MKKLYTILILIKNLIFRRKHYTLHFVAEEDPPIKRWYYDFKHWGFNHAHLEMVAGADNLCDFYAQGKNEVTIDIIASRKRRNYCANLCDEFVAEELPKSFKLKDKYLWGRNYTHINTKGQLITMWICPVTLFVLGRYPKFIYIRRGLML